MHRSEGRAFPSHGRSRRFNPYSAHHHSLAEIRHFIFFPALHRRGWYSMGTQSSPLPPSSPRGDGADLGTVHVVTSLRACDRSSARMACKRMGPGVGMAHPLRLSESLRHPDFVVGERKNERAAMAHPDDRDYARAVRASGAKPGRGFIVLDTLARPDGRAL